MFFPRFFFIQCKFISFRDIDLNFLVFSLVICLVLFSTLIEISHTRSTPIDGNADQNSLVNNNNYYYSLNDHLSRKNPFDEDFYPTNPFQADDIRLNKRIIMLPRVGRRSIQRKK